VDYKGSKVHINQTKRLTEGLRLQPGVFRLGDFDFQLTENLPATCRLPFGNVEYLLKVVIERRGKYNKCFQQRLVIRKSLEFSDLQPQIRETSNVCLTLPRSVFVPGQSVSYEVTSKDGVLDFLTRICKRTNYTSQEPSIKTKTVIQVLSECSDLKGDLRLPLTAPIMSHSDQLEPIQISYFIESFNNCDAPIELPITVATAAPPVFSPVESSRLCFVNLGEPIYSTLIISQVTKYCSPLALSQSELFRPINQFVAHSCSRENGALGLNKHCERLKLLKGPKRKQSYVQLALRYLYKKVLP